MYSSGPRPKPFPTVLDTADPDAHRELQALADLRREDAGQRAYEGVEEFAPLSRPDEWQLMQWDTVEEERSWL